MGFNLENRIVNKILDKGVIGIKTSGSFIVLDSVMRETYKFPNIIVNHPITAGQDRTSHVYKQPAVFTLEGFVSDYYPIIGGVSNPIIDELFDINERSNAALKKFVQLRDDGDFVSVTSSKFFFENMLIQSVDNIQVPSTQSAVNLIITFKNVIVSNVGDSKNASSGQYENVVKRGTQRLESI